MCFPKKLTETNIILSFYIVDFYSFYKTMFHILPRCIWKSFLGDTILKIALPAFCAILKSARELQINFEIECLKDDAENTRLKNAGMRIVEGGGHGQLQLILASQTRVTNNIPSTIQLHHTNRLPPRTSTILPTPSSHTCWPSRPLNACDPFSPICDKPRMRA